MSVKTLTRRRNIAPAAPQSPGLLSKIGSTLSGLASSAGSFLSRLLPSAQSSPSRPSNVYTAKATSGELGYGDLMPMVYHEPKAGQSHYMPPAETDLASKVSGYLARSGHDVSPTSVANILGKLKIPALGALGVAAVAGLVLGAMKLYQKHKESQAPAPSSAPSEQSTEQPAGSGYYRKKHKKRSGAGVISA